MMLETFRIAGCVGRLLTWWYWIRPNTAPITATMMPPHMRVEPMTGLPKTAKTIFSSIGGSCRSASLAKAAGAAARAATTAGAMKRVQFWALAIGIRPGCGVGAGRPVSKGDSVPPAR